MDIILNHISEVVSFILGGTLGSFITLHWTRNKVTNGGKIVDQSNAEAGGDIVGGDKTTIQ